MAIYSDKYIGKKYGSLTVIKYDGKEKTKSGRFSHYFTCKCDCGNEKPLVNINNLRSGRTKSCGCCKAENNIGSKIGHTTIIDTFKTEKGQLKYTLKCECGEVFSVTQPIISTNKYNKHYMCRKCRAKQTIERRERANVN